MYSIGWPPILPCIQFPSLTSRGAKGTCPLPGRIQGQVGMKLPRPSLKVPHISFAPRAREQGDGALWGAVAALGAPSLCDVMTSVRVHGARKSPECLCLSPRKHSVLFLHLMPQCLMPPSSCLRRNVVGSLQVTV